MKTKQLSLRATLFALGLFASSHTSLLFAAKDVADVDKLLDLDFTQLLDVKVDLSSRVEEDAFRAAAAVHVLSAEDIRRSGMRRLPELLRMVPGMHVGKWDANKWAVSSRNALSRFTSTMLVMIDGRHVYTPLFGGVRWEIQDVMLEDVERIEIIRGPGGPLWGANAVDGIINVVTRKAQDTQGSMTYARAGFGEMLGEAGTRYGGKVGDVAYRIFAKSWLSDKGAYAPPSENAYGTRKLVGDTAHDGGRSLLTGMRADWAPSDRQSLSLQMNAFGSGFDEERFPSRIRGIIPNNVGYEGGNALVDWKYKLDPDQNIQVRGWFDYVAIKDDILEEQQRQTDIEIQHNIHLDSHQLAWGVGYRHYDSDVVVPPDLVAACLLCFGLSPEKNQNDIANAFIQDRYALTEDLTLTVGSKFEHNSYTGFEYQPTLRASWDFDTEQTLWTALTRGVRTPTRVDRDRAFYNVPSFLASALGCLSYTDGVCDVGRKNEQSWRVYNVEIGYRARPTQEVGLDLALFRSYYRNNMQFGSTIGTDQVQGFESTLRYQPRADLTFEAQYTLHEGRSKIGSNTYEPLGWLPEQSGSVKGHYKINEQFEFDAMLYVVDEVPMALSTRRLIGYSRADFRLGWHPVKAVEVDLQVSNAFDPTHTEYLESLKVGTSVRRGAMLSVNVSY